jgi:hypothetical protein
MTSGRYDRGDFTSGELTGMTMRSTFFGSLGIAHAKIEGLELGKPLTALLAGDDPTPAMLDGVSLKSMVYGPMSMQGDVGAPSTLGTFSLANVAFAHGWLVSGDLAFDGVRVSRDQLPNLNAVDAFDKLGLDAMTFDVDAGYRWDLDKGVMNVDKATIEVRELGSLSLSFVVNDAGSPHDLLAKGRLAHALLLYKDASLTDRAFKYAATARGTDPTALREQYISTAQQVSVAPDVTPQFAATARAVGDFLNAPRSLAIELSPKEPVPLTTFLAIGNMRPEQLAPVLGLSVVANR